MRFRSVPFQSTASAAFTLLLSAAQLFRMAGPAAALPQKPGYIAICAGGAIILAPVTEHADRVGQLVLLAACLGMIVMSVSAVVMWWKRRPAGSLGAPAFPADWRIPKIILGIAVVAGIFFALVGLTLLVVCAIELCRFGLLRTRAARASRVPASITAVARSIAKANHARPHGRPGYELVRPGRPPMR